MLQQTQRNWHTNTHNTQKKKQKIKGNVHAHQHVLLVESCTGLLLGAIAERMGGYGKIFNGYSEVHPSINIAREMQHLTLVKQKF